MDSPVHSQRPSYMNSMCSHRSSVHLFSCGFKWWRPPMIREKTLLVPILVTDRIEVVGRASENAFSATRLDPVVRNVLPEDSYAKAMRLDCVGLPASLPGAGTMEQRSRWKSSSHPLRNHDGVFAAGERKKRKAIVRASRIFSHLASVLVRR